MVGFMFPGTNHVAYTVKGNPISRETQEARGTGLESSITTLSGEDKILFLEFVTKMLQ